MKLKKISIYQHDLPVKNGPYRMANASVYKLDTTLVRLESECGTVGWGGRPVRWDLPTRRVMPQAPERR